MKFPKLISLCLSVLLAGCGAGGVGTEFLAANPVSAFSRTSIVLPDLEPIYASFCPTDGRALQHVVPVDMNKDGKMDLVLWLWCSPVTDHSLYTGPTPSRIVVLLQDAQGNFNIGTSSIFGTDIVEPGSSVENYVTSDFNGDGYVDIFWATQREDGRGYTDWSTQWASNIVLMSQGNGTYRMIEVGTPTWNSGVTLVDNARGGQDVIATSNAHPVKRWSYDSSSGWTSTEYSWVGSNGSEFFSRTSPTTGSTTALISLASQTQIGVRLYSTPDGINWNGGGTFAYPSSVIQKIDNRSGAVPAAFVSIDGEDFVDPSFGFTCQIKRTPTSSPEMLTVFEAQKIIGGYHGQIVEFYSPTSPLQEMFKIMSFSPGQDNALVRNNITIRNEITVDVKANRMSCRDVNGDGYDDIVLFVSKPEQTPVVYLNDGKGSFDLVNSAAFPKSPSTHRSSNYIFADINNDGLKDLIYFQISGLSTFSSRLEIFRAQRKLNILDVVR